jgi:hypothetical protein
VFEDSSQRGGYANSRGAAGTEEGALDFGQIEDLKYIKETILALTGGCEICSFSVGPFCNKHRRAIKPGDPRCVDFARRFPDDPRAASRAQVRDYVTSTLGVSDKASIVKLTADA